MKAKQKTPAPGVLVSFLLKRDVGGRLQSHASWMRWHRHSGAQLFANSAARAELRAFIESKHPGWRFVGMSWDYQIASDIQGTYYEPDGFRLISEGAA